MEKKFITNERMRSLQESIGFLDNYTIVPGEQHHVGPDIDTVYKTHTALLDELGQINVRRKYLIELLMGGEPTPNVIGYPDKNGKSINLGSVIDVHQTINGCRTFIVTGNNEVRYFYNDKPQNKYEYNVMELLDINEHEKTIEIIDNVAQS